MCRGVKIGPWETQKMNHRGGVQVGRSIGWIHTTLQRGSGPLQGGQRISWGGCGVSSSRMGPFNGRYGVTLWKGWALSQGRWKGWVLPHEGRAWELLRLWNRVGVLVA